MVTKKISSSKVKQPAPRAVKTPVTKIAIEELPKPPKEEVDDVPVVVPESSPSPDVSGSTSGSAPDLIDKEKILSFIEDIIDTLTFKRVALIGLLTVIGLSLYSLFENRQGIVERIVEPQAAAQPVVTTWELSQESRTALQTLAKDTNVAFVAVSDVDLQKNRRTIRYYYVDETADLMLQPATVRNLSLPQAVFDYDARNTAQMVSILSNEFRCDNFNETIYFRYAPELENKLPSVCRIAIPPFVGQFVGFLTVALDKPITKVEADTIRLEASRIAVDIYLNDVIKKPAEAE